MHCAYHPETPGIGICVSCTRIVCGSCTTRLQGRNFCRMCIDRRSRTTAPIPLRSGPLGRAVATVFSGVAAAALLLGLFVSGYLLHWFG